MTINATGSIAVSRVNTEVGRASTYSTNLRWITDNTKTGNKSDALGGVRGLAWYQKTNAGNCNNGNCGSAGNCGNIQCTNCYSYQCINCVNCDARAWLQSNCNCACTYNCNAGAVSYNCNCDCNCDCNCNCWGG